MNPFRTPPTFLSGDGLRVWTNPKGSPNFIVFLHGNFYTATIPDSEMATAIRDLSAGLAPPAVLGQSTREICLLSVSRVMLNTRDNSLEINHVTRLGNATDRVTFHYREDLDEIQILLQKQLREPFVTEPIGFSLWKTLGGPLVALVIAALLFWFCWGIIGPGGQPHRVYWHERFLQDQVGPQRLMWAGAILAGFIFLWAVGRVLTRPVGVRIRKVEG
ncbi:MAG TPA: hypothetical protein VGZ47_14895 [Gemmataceae bacterium]|nr:hypothetical protein [Gemmataceae bacterium]